jgi:hypothetical protein
MQVLHLDTMLVYIEHNNLFRRPNLLASHHPYNHTYYQFRNQHIHHLHMFALVDTKHLRMDL